MPFKKRYYTKAVGRQRFASFTQLKSMRMPLNGGVAHGVITLVNNEVNQNQYVPPVMKVKCLKAQLTAPACPAPIIQNTGMFRGYLMYLPQGVNFQVGLQQLNGDLVLTGTIEQHPEWIMAQKNIYISADTTNAVYITSPLTRNLQSGDRIVLILIHYSQGPNPQQIAGINIPINVITNYCARSN